MSRNYFLPSRNGVSRAFNMAGVRTWLRASAADSGLSVLRRRGSRRPVAAEVSLASLSLSRFHLPVPLGSIPITGLLRYYEDSDAFRARNSGLLRP